MFDVGFSELVLVFVIGLLILGPERLPRVAAQIGRWVSHARRTANQLRHQLEREMALDEINRNKKPPPRPTSTDRKPPGDETAGASHSADGSAGHGDAPSDATPSPVDGNSAASSVPDAARPDDTAPDGDTRVEERTEATGTLNS